MYFIYYGLLCLFCICFANLYHSYLDIKFINRYDCVYTKDIYYCNKLKQEVKLNYRKRFYNSYLERIVKDE